MTARELRVIERATGEVVERIPLTGNEREDRLVRSGLLMQMNTQEYRLETGEADA